MKRFSRGMVEREKKDGGKMMRGLSLERAVCWFMSPCMFNEPLKCKTADLLPQRVWG